VRCRRSCACHHGRHVHRRRALSQPVLSLPSSPILPLQATCNCARSSRVSLKSGDLTASAVSVSRYATCMTSRGASRGFSWTVSGSAISQAFKLFTCMYGLALMLTSCRTTATSLRFSSWASRAYTGSETPLFGRTLDLTATFKSCLDRNWYNFLRVLDSGPPTSLACVPECSKLPVLQISHSYSKHMVSLFF